MGEISKRTKHKWMRWTTKGLETILNLILERYVSESYGLKLYLLAVNFN